jgi:hypothetical protein
VIIFKPPFPRIFSMSCHPPPKRLTQNLKQNGKKCRMIGCESMRGRLQAIGRRVATGGHTPPGAGAGELPPPPSRTLLSAFFVSLSVAPLLQTPLQHSAGMFCLTRFSGCHSACITYLISFVDAHVPVIAIHQHLGTCSVLTSGNSIPDSFSTVASGETRASGFPARPLSRQGRKAWIWLQQAAVV